MVIRKDKGYIGTEIEAILLDDEGKVVDQFKVVSKKIPKKERGRRHIDIEKSRVTHDVWFSQPEINVRPFWEDQFDDFYQELSHLVIDLYEAAKSSGYQLCLLPIPPLPHRDPMIRESQPRDAETQSIHYHYSVGGGFPDKFSRLPFYNAFVLTYLLLAPATFTSFYAYGKRRNYLSTRFNLATAVYPPPYLDPNSTLDHNYILKEINEIQSEIGLVHPVPENVRLFDISFLTKEEAYWLIPRKSTVELRPFDTVPSLLIIEALWLMVAAIGKKVISNKNSFIKIHKDVFRVIWRLRSRVIKDGFRAPLPKIEKEKLPTIDDEKWPRYLYDNEIGNVREAMLWLMDDLQPELDQITETSTMAKAVLSKFKSFIKEGLTPVERILIRFKGKDITRALIQVNEEAIYDPFYIP